MVDCIGRLLLRGISMRTASDRHILPPRRGVSPACLKKKKKPGEEEKGEGRRERRDAMNGAASRNRTCPVGIVARSSRATILFSERYIVSDGTDGLSARKRPPSALISELRAARSPSDLYARARAPDLSPSPPSPPPG